MDGPEACRVLAEFSAALILEADNLRQRPELLWQQLYNRLQWADGPNQDGVVTAALAPELGRRRDLNAGAWLHLLSQPQESDARIRSLVGHTEGILVLAVSPDGTRIASGSDDGTVKFWDASTGRRVVTIKAHKFSVNAIAYSPDGTRIVSGSGCYPEHEVREQDNVLRIWDAASGKGIATLTGHRNVVRAVAYAPDGSRIISGSDDRTVRVWDAVRGEELAAFLGHKDAVLAVAYSPDGTRIVSGSREGSVRVWDSGTFVEPSTFRHAPSGVALAAVDGHGAGVLAVAYSPAGTRIVSGSADNTLRLWEAATLECLAILPCGGPVESCDHGPAGRIRCGDATGAVYLLELLGAGVQQAPAPGVDAGPSQWKGLSQEVAELPQVLIKAGKWDDLFATLTDFTYLEARATRDGLATTEDEQRSSWLWMLIDDYDMALAAIPESWVPDGTHQPTWHARDRRESLVPAGPQVFTFRGADLGSKYGFDDGDVLNDLVAELHGVGGPEVDPHSVLADTLRRYLFPAIQECPGRIPGVSLWLTAHNPVRFVDDEGHDLPRAGAGDVVFDEVEVIVSAEEIREVTRDLDDAGLTRFGAYKQAFEGHYPSTPPGWRTPT